MTTLHHVFASILLTFFFIVMGIGNYFYDFGTASYLLGGELPVTDSLLGLSMLCASLVCLISGVIFFDIHKQEMGLKKVTSN